MADLATLVIRLMGDATQFQGEMRKTEQEARSWSTGLSASMQTIGTSMANIGRNLSTFVTLPIAGASVAVIKFASDLEETKNKVSVVFGSMSDDVLAWSQNAASSMGQSQEGALAATATYGNLFVTMGLGQQPAAEMSMSLVQLASDLASFNNASPEEVLQAMQSGLVGQVEPLRKYGVVLSEAAVQAKALEMGLADTSGELSEAAKLQARYAIILEQTGTAQGDFARTADGLANSQRILTAQLKDVGAALGVQLLPYALQFAQWASDMVAKFQSLSPEQQKWIMIIGGVVAVIGPLLMIVGTLITAIGAIIPVVTAVAGALTFPLIAIILAVIAVAALLYAAWKNNWGGIQEKTKAVIDFVKGVIEGGMQFIQDLTSGKLGALSQIWSNTWNLVKLVFNTVVENIKSIFALFQAAFSGDWTRFGEILREIWDRNWNLIGEILKTAWENIKLVVKGLINGIVNFFTTTDWASLGRAIVQGIVNGLISLASWALDQIVSFGQAIADVLAGFFGISSPSKLMEEMIGKPLAMGVVVGWKNILGGDPFAPALVGAMETPVVSMPALGMRGGGRSVMMQFTYAPAISLGDRFEAEQVLAPMIAEAVRRRLEQEG